MSATQTRPAKAGHKGGILRHYWFDFLVTAFAVAGTLYFMGLLSGFQLAILIVLEITFSFDNAVVNASILNKMSPLWQLLFMTVGIPIAVVGMRFLFPIIIVMLSANLSFGDVWNLALHEPHTYAEKLEVAHPAIAIFGGVFLLLIFLNFILEERKVTWVSWLERPLSRVGKAGKLDVASLFIAILVVWLVAVTASSHEEKEIFAWGVASILLYVAVSFASSFFEDDDDGDDEDDDSTTFTLEDDNTPKKTGMAAFAAFMYLEVQDAAFSFDGVSGAFAISDMIILIALGLGIGALFVRSMTVHLVRSKTLAKYRYLEHGAHYAIGVLALCMIVSIHVNIPDWVTGSIGVVFIAAAVRASLKANKLAELEAQNKAAAEFTELPPPTASPETIRALGATALRGSGVTFSDDEPTGRGGMQN